MPPTPATPRALALVAALALALAACAQQPAADEPDDDPRLVRVYTTVTQDTVDAVTDGFEDAHPAAEVEVFRAPTGEFNARVAAERRDGEIGADVFWLTDPLSMLAFDADGLLAQWEPEGAGSVPEAYRHDTYWGTRLLHLVIVASDELEAAPERWWDLADPDVVASSALPDPGFAGSAFGALGWFALDDDHGLGWYEAIAGNGAVQVDAPDEVVAGVAEGRFDAGLTLDRLARDAEEAGSPLEVVWPEPAAIAIDSPIAVLDGAAAGELAEAFVEHVLSAEAQERIAETGWQPIDPDVPWPHTGGATTTPDWDAAFAQRDELLERYRSAMGQ